MNADIPKMRVAKIEREVPFTLPYEEHSSVKKNREAAERETERRRQIAACCAHLEASNPGAWHRLQELLNEQYGAVKMRNRASPFNYLAEGREAGYWAICEAFNRGQLIILEMILVTLGVSEKQIAPFSPPRKSRIPSFFFLMFDKLRKLCH